MESHPRRPRLRPRFFADGMCAVGAEITLAPDDSHHASHVLRMRPGDLCEVATSPGGVCEAVVVGVDGAVRVRLLEAKSGEEAGALYRTVVGLVQALARPSALDYAVEKATEAGASFFMLVRAGSCPYFADRDMRERLARWQRIAREAAKQSRQTVVPSVELMVSPEAALAALAGKGIRSIVLDPAAKTPLREAVLSVEEPGLALWVGPEGGWDSKELDGLQLAGARPARLGRAVLRTETAGPIAVAASRLVLGDW